MDQPKIIAVAGPNGAGKSTAAPIVLKTLFGPLPYVNADVIASGFSPFSPETVAFEAGRVMLKRMWTLAELQQSFAFETTLSGRGYTSWIYKLKDQGYTFHLVFLWLESAQLAIERVHQRVAAGGHAIPEATVLRRYRKGLDHFFHLYRPMADSWSLFNNSRNQVEAIAFGRGHAVTFLQNPPLWEKVRGSL